MACASSDSAMRCALSTFDATVSAKNWPRSVFALRRSPAPLKACAHRPAPSKSSDAAFNLSGGASPSSGQHRLTSRHRWSRKTTSETSQRPSKWGKSDRHNYSACLRGIGCRHQLLDSYVRRAGRLRHAEQGDAAERAEKKRRHLQSAHNERKMCA